MKLQSSVSRLGEISPNGRIWGLNFWRKWTKLAQKIGESGENEQKVGDLGKI